MAHRSAVLPHTAGRIKRPPRSNGVPYSGITIYNQQRSPDNTGVFELPIIAKPGFILLLFLGELLILHVLFIVIPFLRLKKTGWAVVQYLVTALALLGLLSAVSNARQLVAGGMLSISGPHLKFEFRDLRLRVDDYSSPGIVCRTFVRIEYSPPAEEFNRTQREYDDICQWFKIVPGVIPRELPGGDPEISWESLPPSPQISDEQLKGTIRLFKGTLDSYNQAARADRDLQVNSRRSDADSFFIFLLPLSLSLALALQATKLTADTWWKTW